MICGILLLVLQTVSTATGQTSGTAALSPTIVNSCEDQLKTALERLDKTLDAYEKATKALSFATDEIAARKAQDALKDQLIAVKDLIIAEQGKLIKFYQGGEKEKGFKAKLKQILAIAEKIALIALGASIGRGL